MRGTALRSSAAIAPLLAAILALPSAAAAADLHATTDGAGDCTSVAQSCTLGAAIAAARGNDRVLVYPGVHGVGGIVADHAGAAHVEVLGAPGESRPVIDLTGGRLDLLHGTDLRGVDVVTTAGTAVRSVGGMLDHLRVSVTGSDTVGAELGSGSVLRNSAVIASGSRSSGVLATAGGIAHAEVRGCTVVASGIDAAALRVAANDPGAEASARAVNSILRGSGGAVDVHATEGAGGERATATLDHVASVPTGQVAVGSAATIETEPGALTAAPIFQDRVNGDLRQTAASPTIDAGTTDVDGNGVTDAADASAAGVTDLDGSQRRLGMPDVGADEREMPPVVLEAGVIFENGGVALRVLVQPRGQLTEIAADWGVDGAPWMAAEAKQAVGNDPVVVSIPLGALPPGARGVTAQARASNSAGSVRAAVAGEIPVGAIPMPTSVGGAPVQKAAPIGPPVRPQLPGARPTLLGATATQSGGTFAFRLRCRHTVSCRGQVLLTRLGPVRVDTFKIPPGAERTVELRLTSAQAARVRRAGTRGLRGLLEIRSLDDGSSWTAVRLYRAGHRR